MAELLLHAAATNLVTAMAMFAAIAEKIAL
jgi:hypothetical protein